MNHADSGSEFEPLESPLAAAVAAILAEPIPTEAIEHVKTRAKGLTDVVAHPPRPEGRFAGRRKLSRVLVGGSIAAVAALALMSGLNLLTDRAADRAFAQVVEKVKSANSVRFKMTSRYGRQPEAEDLFFFDGSRMRSEQFHGKRIEIADLDQKRVLYLDTHRKLAQSTELNAKLAELLVNPIDQLRRVKTHGAELMGEEMLDGRRSVVYRLRKSTLLGLQGDMLLWVNPQTELPMKIVIHDSDARHGGEVRLDGFVLEQPSDAGLFALNLPAGFATGVLLPVLGPEPPLPVAGSLDAPNVSRDGVLSRDRVPRRIVWSTDGKTLTALMKDPESAGGPRRSNELRQWDVATGNSAGGNRLEEPLSAASTDGKTLAITIGREAQLRDAATGEIIRKWETETAAPPVAFSPDGRFLAMGLEGWGQGGAKQFGGVQIFDAEHGSLVRSIAEEEPTTFVGYSRDGKLVASSSNGGPVQLWDTATGEVARIFRGAKAAFSPDGGSIACASMEWNTQKTEAWGKVNLYDLKTAGAHQDVHD